MQTDSRNVTITLAQPTISLPSSLCTGLTGPGYIDALPVPTGANYPSAAILGTMMSNGTTLGMLAWSPTSNWLQVAPDSLGSFTAVCGISGGLIALARVDQGVPSVELRNSALVDPDWGTAGTITFGNITGTIQAMAQREDLLYGFIKSSPKNAFFKVAPQAGAEAVVVYYDAAEAAVAFFPRAKQTKYLGMPKPIAFCGERMYAVGESHANVLCASLHDCTTTSFPSPKADTWGLYTDEPLSKVYVLYDVAHGYVLPYTIRDDGSFFREPGIDTLKGGAADCPALDPNLRLLYMVSPFAGLQVADVNTEKMIPLGKKNPLPPFFVDPAGTWADSANSLLIIAGVKSQYNRYIGIYNVSVGS